MLKRLIHDDDYQELNYVDDTDDELSLGLPSGPQFGEGQECSGEFECSQLFSDYILDLGSFYTGNIFSLDSCAFSATLLFPMLTI